MTTPPQVQVPHWQVTGIQAGATSTDASGSVVTGREVTFRFDDGTTDQVFVSDQQWNAGQAIALISQAAAATANVRYAEGGGG